LGIEERSTSCYEREENLAKVAIITLDWAMATEAGEQVAHGVYLSSAQSFSNVAVQDLPPMILRDGAIDFIGGNRTPV
jgi:hypothetical protein